MAIVNTYTSNTTVSIPANAYDVQITVSSAKGGNGGDAPAGGGSRGIPSTLPGGIGGAGRIGTFRYKTSFVARTLTIRVGQAGTTGRTWAQLPVSGPVGGTYFNQPNCGGRISSTGSGACGGSGTWDPYNGFTGFPSDQNQLQWSEGGSGSGATGVFENSVLLINAGGGGGGTGAQYTGSFQGGGDSRSYVNGVAGNPAGNWVASSSISFSNGANQSGGGSGITYSSGGGGGGSLGGAAPAASPPVRPGNGGGSQYNSAVFDLISSSSNSSSISSVTVSYEVSFVDITSFTANPNPQTSGSDGVSNYDTTLSWVVNSVIFPLTYTITSGTFTTSGTTNTTAGNVTITNLPQSEAGVTSPATRTYTLTMTDGATSDTSSVTVSVYNDNTPNNYTIPDQNNVEPSTVITIQIGPITGIDMLTNVTGGSGVSVSNNNINYSSFTTVQNNQDIYIRVTSLPFNTDPNGLTNTASFSVTVGTVQRFFTLTTRAPDVNETFNFSNKEDYVPYPDIDTIPDPDADIRNQSNPYLVSETLLIDDIELGSPTGVEIKVDNPNAQIRVKRSGSSTFENWQDVRSI
jgi:hypothetical protein